METAIPFPCLCLFLFPSLFLLSPLLLLLYPSLCFFSIFLPPSAPPGTFFLPFFLPTPSGFLALPPPLPTPLLSFSSFPHQLLKSCLPAAGSSLACGDCLQLQGEVSHALLSLACPPISPIPAYWPGCLQTVHPAPRSLVHPHLLCSPRQCQTMTSTAL